MPIEQIEAIGRAPLAALDDIMRAICADHAAGRLTDDETQALYEAVYARRKALKRPVPGHSPLKVVLVREGAERPPVTNVEPRRVARSGPRQLVLVRVPRLRPEQRLRAIERRRSIAASGMMPGPLAASFTVSEQSALAVIAREVMEHGTCGLCLEAIAARSGTSRSTVKRAIKQARALGLIRVEERPRPGQKHLPSIIRIVSAAWLAWLKHRTRHRIGVQGWTATDTCVFRKGFGGNGVRATAEATQRPNDRGPDRAHRHSAL